MSWVRRFGPGLWTALLAGAVALSLVTAFLKTAEEPEFPNGCDGFGYLHMAEEFRRAVRGGAGPELGIEDKQPRLLIEFLKRSGKPSAVWEEGVAPLAYHYSERVDGLINTYPPGTSLTLAPFEEGKAVRLLNRWTIGLVGLVALLLGWLAWRSGRWAELGLLALAAHFTVRVISTLGGRSYSLNALAGPLLLATCLAAGAWPGRGRWARWAPVACGALMGWATLVRLPSVILVPGLLALSIGTIGDLVRFGGGFVALGLGPLLAYQAWAAGAWNASTYGHLNATSPELSEVAHHLGYYLAGAGGVQNWALWVSLLGAAGLAWRGQGLKRSGRLFVGVGGIWVGSLAFFVTHKIYTTYYMIPATWVAVWAIAIGMAGRGEAAEVTLEEAPARGWRAKAACLAWVPGVAALVQSAAFARNNADFLRVPTWELPVTHARSADVPEELQDPDAWIWADMDSGTFWYAARKAAFKPAYFDAETRDQVYAFVRARGEPQYFVADFDGAPALMRDFARLGAELEPRGSVFGHPYFRLRF